MDILTGVFLRFVGLFAYLFGFWEEGGGVNLVHFLNYFCLFNFFVVVVAWLIQKKE